MSMNKSKCSEYSVLCTGINLHYDVLFGLGLPWFVYVPVNNLLAEVCYDHPYVSFALLLPPTLKKLSHTPFKRLLGVNLNH